ncbi:MAG: hypothetical protein FOGNACKC_00943 [Anaerolineae bacterium]|nr:hypothetical protein [Anaerolineae bacterium]
MAQQIIHKIGIDPGFDSFVAGEAQNGSVNVAVLPSPVALPARLKTGLQVAETGYRGPRHEKPQIVAFNGTQLLTGANVELYNEPIQRLDYKRFSDSAELRAPLYASIYRLLGGGYHKVALGIALPVEILEDPTNAAQVGNEVKKWLSGIHRYSVDGQAVTMEVVAVKSKIPQPLATWANWGFNTSGQWGRPLDDLQTPVLVIDLGYNTVDVVLVENGQIGHRHYGGERLGMRRAIEALNDLLRHSYGPRAKLDPITANKAVVAAINNQPALVWLKGKKTDISGLAAQAVEKAISDVLEYIEGILNQSGGQYLILVTGGGAYALFPRLREAFDHATMVADPVTANGIGLAKLVQRPRFFGTEI